MSSISDELPVDQHPADRELRELLAAADPQRSGSSDFEELGPTDHLWTRLQETITTIQAPVEKSDRLVVIKSRPKLALRLRTHWATGLLVAAGVSSLALAAGSTLPGRGGSDASSATDIAAQATAVPGSSGSAPVGSDSSSEGSLLDQADRDPAAAGNGGTAQGGDAAQKVSESKSSDESAMVRSASLLIGTDDVGSARDRFVAAVLAMGGRVLSESVVATKRSSNLIGVDESMGSYPTPWYPSGPGIWLGVQVPTDQYEKAVAAARTAGEVVQSQQSAYDVGSQVSENETRIRALDTSLKRLNALMSQANGISDVIALEGAIADRQSELDALRSEQRSLANQTAMSTINVSFMTPTDARSSVDPMPTRTWWESFVSGLSGFWNWLGGALVIASPLLFVGVLIAWIRRRQRRNLRGATGEPQEI